MVRLGAILMFFGFVSAGLHYTDVQLRLLFWSEPMQPLLGLVVGGVGLALFAGKIIFGKDDTPAAPQFAGPPMGAPQPGYGAPQAGYGPPQPGYGPPQPGYGAPAPQQFAPQQGYAAQTGPNSGPVPMGAPMGAVQPGSQGQAQGYGAPQGYAPQAGAPQQGYGQPQNFGPQG